jgi:hypothetical protein
LRGPPKFQDRDHVSKHVVLRAGVVTRAPVLHLLILGALMAAQIACGIFASVASSDTSRDIFFAQQIAAGQSFPLTGPAINGMLHLGPLWYYLLAIPLLFVPNAAAVTGMMGLLSAMQFPLAYVLGRRLRNPDEGLLFALSLALPGWIVTSFGSLTHPIIAIPALLLGALAAVEYNDKPDASHATKLGLALVLMGTAHPTLALPGLLLLFWCGRHAHGWQARLQHLGIIAALVAVALLPMLYEQWLLGFSDADKAAAHTRSELSLPSLMQALELIHAIAIHGPNYVTRYWLELSATGTQVLFVVYALILLLAAIGLVASYDDAAVRRYALVLISVLLLHSMFVCAIRVLMPPWMIYSHGLLLSALIALGLGQLWRSVVLRTVIALLLATTTLWTTSTYANLMLGSTEFTNVQPSPGKHGFMDVRDYEDTSETLRIARVPFHELFALGESLCDSVALYGHYAYLIDYTYAVSAAHVCGSTKNVQFGGMPEAGRERLMGLHRDAWLAIGMAPEDWLGSLGISQPREIWHSPVPLTPVVPTFSNFPRSLSHIAGTFTVEGNVASPLAVLISHRAHRYLPFKVIRARVDGRDVAAHYSDLTSAIFIAPNTTSDEAVHWQFDIEGNEAYVDLLTFAGRE